MYVYAYVLVVARAPLAYYVGVNNKGTQYSRLFPALRETMHLGIMHLGRVHCIYIYYIHINMTIVSI